ncbi:folate-binding protein [Pelagibacteraceae bacterium]|nr:folate-binding protein [Pelagibacteraceae bacterium]MDC0952730.1 folate-binding protein [Pelagibacteraceae bacterium]
MKKDQIIILENRGLISVTGDDAKEFLQNIVTNDIEKVDQDNSIYSALLSPQGKYLHEFFIIHVDKGYLIDCDNKSKEDLINNLSKYKLRSKVDLKDLSSDYVIGVINLEKFNEIQSESKESSDTIIYRESPLFIDPRKKELGARILSSLEKLHLTIKKLSLKIIDSKEYFNHAHDLGVPEKGLVNLKEQLFGLEANFEELNAIDFKKGCYIGQENTARMKLKNKLRRRLLAVKADGEVLIDDDLTFGEIKIGKILINKPYPFALIKLFDPDFSTFKDKELNCGNTKVKIISSY